MSKKKNKVRFGLKNCYYAKATFDEDGNVTYGKPVRLPGAVSIGLDPEGESENFYALEGSNNYTSNSLKFPSGSYQNKFKKLLKKGKKLKVEIEFANAGTQKIEFNIEGLDPSYIK